MAHRAFEAFAESLSQRRATRRGALAASVAGALGVAGAAGAAAQDATPQAEDAAHPMFLFVQLGEAGTWIPSAGDPEIYELTLTGIGSQVAFFSDRPERIVGTLDTDRFLDELGFTPVNPPNAAAVVRTPEGERDVLVVELFDPIYTRTYGDNGDTSLTYKARVLDAYHGDNLTSWYDDQDNPELPSQFDQVSLFIDDCPGIDMCLLLPGAVPRDAESRDVTVGYIPGGPYPMCWDSESMRCFPCQDRSDELAQLCNSTYPKCRNLCWAA
jgi:hypothetical protein